jgi:peptidoglycan/LPS O-acetylase OafA/YrhL
VREAAADRRQVAGRAPSRLAGIEGLRAIAATSILVYHVHLYGAPDREPVELGALSKVFENLRAGVTLFFVLSGFLLYRVFIQALARDGSLPGIRSYTRNRLLRIVPAYWVILIGVVLVFEHRVLREPLQLLANLLFLQNYIPAYEGGDRDVAIIAPAWSLVIEMSFYAVLPALGVLAFVCVRRGMSVAAGALMPVAFMFAIGFVSKALAHGLPEGSDGRAVFDHTLLTHADWFAAGMAVAVASVVYERSVLRLPAWRFWAVVVALVLALVSTKLFYDGTLNGLEQQTFIALGCALLLGVVVFSSPASRVVRWLSFRWMVFAGLVSYSVFLVHDPLVRGLGDWGLTLGGRGGFLVNLALLTLASYGVATLTYLYVERPALARKRRWQAGDVAGLGSTAAPGADPSQSIDEALSTEVEARVERA